MMLFNIKMMSASIVLSMVSIIRNHSLQMLMNNPLVAANPHMKNQVKSFLPMFLNQVRRDSAFVVVRLFLDQMKDRSLARSTVYQSSIDSSDLSFLPSVSFRIPSTCR